MKAGGSAILFMPYRANAHKDVEGHPVFRHWA